MVGFCFFVCVYYTYGEGAKIGDILIPKWFARENADVMTLKMTY